MERVNSETDLASLLCSLKQGLTGEVSPGGVEACSSINPTAETLIQLSDILVARLTPRLAESIGKQLRDAFAEEARKICKDVDQLRHDVSKLLKDSGERGPTARDEHDSRTSDSVNWADESVNDERPANIPSASAKAVQLQEHEHQRRHTMGRNLETIVEAHGANLPNKPNASGASPSQGRGLSISTCPALPELGGTIGRSPREPPGRSAWAHRRPLPASGSQDLAHIEQRLTTELLNSRELLASKDRRHKPNQVAAADAPSTRAVAGSYKLNSLLPVMPATSEPQQGTSLQDSITHPQDEPPVLQLTRQQAKAQHASSSGATGEDTMMAKPQPPRRDGVLPYTAPHDRALCAEHPQQVPASSACDNDSQGAESRQVSNGDRALCADTPQPVRASSACDIRSPGEESRQGSKHRAVSSPPCSEGSCLTDKSRPGGGNQSRRSQCPQRRQVPSLDFQRSQENAKVIDLERSKGVAEVELSSMAMEGHLSYFCLLLKVAAVWCIYAVPRFCGIVPWHARSRWSGWAYQVLVLMIGFTCCCWHVVRLITSISIDAAQLPEAHQCIDLIVALGGLVPLIAFGGLWQNQDFATNIEVLSEYAHREGFLPQCRKLIFAETVCTFVLWSVAVCARVLERGAEPASLLDLVAFICTSGMTAGIITQLLSLCRYLTKMVDTFCYNVVEQPDFSVAAQEWTFVQAICRTGCASVQWPFAALQTTGALIALVVITELRDGLAHAKTLFPALLVYALILRVGFWSAAVTDKCARVPMLVNAIAVEQERAKERMFVADYIVHSRAGFYVFEVCLSTGTILKALYVLGAVTFTVASRW